MNQIKRLVRAVLKRSGYDLVRKSDNKIKEERFPRGPFRAQQEIMMHLGISDTIIFDVGAHKGSTAKKYRSLFANAQIYCFEAFPQSCAKLSSRFAADDRLTVVQKAIGIEIGHATFYVNEFDATNSLLPRPSSGRRYYPSFAGPKKTIDVDVINLDYFVEEQKLPKVDILKLDIQGGELNALLGAERLLKEGNISLIYTEIMFVPHYQDSPLFHEVWSLLTKHGFSLFDVYNLSRASNGQIRQGDALFVSENVRTKVLDRYTEES